MSDVVQRGPIPLLKIESTAGSPVSNIPLLSAPPNTPTILMSATDALISPTSALHHSHHHQGHLDPVLPYQPHHSLHELQPLSANGHHDAIHVSLIGAPSHSD